MASLTRFVDTSTLLKTTGIATAAYFICLAIYRLYFHPLSKIPGPRIAAITYWYETYYDLFNTPNGQYWNKLEELHKVYGPIIRINPDEVQINDPDFYDKIYAGGSTKRNRHASSVAGNGSPGSMASAVSHSLHRVRRSSLNPFFSKSAVLKLEERIQSRVKVMSKKLSNLMEQGEIVDIGIIMTALTVDVISEYSFGESWNLLNQDNMGYIFVVGMRMGFRGSQLMKRVSPVIQMIPQTVLERLHPGMKSYFILKRQIIEICKRMNARNDTSSSSSVTNKDQINLFTEAMDRLPEDEKELERLTDEAFVVIVAGSETTGRTLTSMIFHVLANPKIHSRLLDELDANMTDTSAETPFTTLEALPYLTAVIRETLRISALVPNRSLLTSETLVQYKEWTLQPGTPICMNNCKLLLDASIYSEPLTFDPERWLGDSTDVQKRLRYFVPFSKGHRSCLGMNLAYAELYLASANLFRYFDIRLHDVIRERDVEAVSDAFVGMPSLESKGVRLELLGKRK